MTKNLGLPPGILPKAPFPYFGVKATIAPSVWETFGQVKNYVEPFAGTAAVLLQASFPTKRKETLNDVDGFVVNFFRAVKADPEGVATMADHPVTAVDLYARDRQLNELRGTLTTKLCQDPHYCDAQAAGWWCYCMCAAIRPDQVCNGKLSLRLPDLGSNGGGKGINRRVPLPKVGKPHGINGLAIGNYPNRSEFIKTWMKYLSTRLRDVRVTCSDWTTVLSPAVTTQIGLTAVFLDPPYEKGDMSYGAGGMGQGIAKAVQAWCIENGNNPLFKLVLCGRCDEHDVLLAHGWRSQGWIANKGFAKNGGHKEEKLWLSPHCINKQTVLF